MESILSDLKKRRLLLLMTNLAYFVLLLVLGYLILIRGYGGAWYAAAGVIIVAYVLIIRPITVSYKKSVRRAILQYGVCRELTGMTYKPKSGFTVEEFQASELVNTVSDKAFLSREKVIGHKGGFRIAMADVTFPIRENGRNAMSSGLYLTITGNNVIFPKLTVRAGQFDDLQINGAAASLLQEMASFIPGNLYIQTQTDAIHLFFRGRFVCFPVNPLININEKTLQSNPLPELQQSIKLAQILMLQGRADQSERTG